MKPCTPHIHCEFSNPYPPALRRINFVQFPLDHYWTSLTLTPQKSEVPLNLYVWPPVKLVSCVSNKTKMPTLKPRQSFLWHLKKHRTYMYDSFVSDQLEFWAQLSNFLCSHHLGYQAYITRLIDHIHIASIGLELACNGGSCGRISIHLH